MYITRTRVIIADVILLVALGFMYTVTKGFTSNVTAFSLVVALLLARSIYWHISWYKTTRKIY